MADAFEDQLDQSLTTLKEKFGNKVKVTKRRQLVGLDAYQQLVDLDVDVVLLAAPPAFRADHLEAAVNAGKHIFRSEEHTSELQSLMRISYAVFCLTKKN